MVTATEAADAHKTRSVRADLSQSSKAVSYTHLIDSIGQSIFSPSESGKHQYLTIQGEENIRATRNALIRQVTGKEN